MKKNTKILLGTAAIATGAVLLAFTQKENLPLETVAYVDLGKYQGRWYEIAAFPQRFEKGCFCSSAEYKLMPEGYMRVKNSCRKNGPNGKMKTVIGKALVTDKKTNAKLKVQFFWPFHGSYWIIDLAPDYSYAVVGEPSRKYLWILARQPAIDPSLYLQLVAKIQQKGFNVSKLKIMDQSCN